MDFIQRIEKTFQKAEVPAFRVGDSVDVHYRIKEGDRERVQVFSGVVLGAKGSGLRRSVIVRRIVQGEGVERTFPLHSPRVADIVVKRHGRVRRAKLYYLRDRAGKATRLEDTFERIERPAKKSPAAAPAPAGAVAAAAAAPVAGQ